MSADESNVTEYLSRDETVTYTLSHRPTGFTNWVKSQFGIGTTHWYLTDQRLIEYVNVTGGFNFQDLPIENITSVEYGRQLNLLAIGAGAVLMVLGLVSLLSSPGMALLMLLVGAGVVAYAFYRRQQGLVVHASGVTLSLHISRGEQVDEFLWYVNEQRQDDPAENRLVA
ncbi:hypothetical protein [Halomarina litorea]|uniref:hypothetical protein n=1 Tax=Halomarina litorea TaxID=2961595 RepID=UPI0020C27D4A|nr:hypothetical protein [Halomarina sp. BCD28]